MKLSTCSLVFLYLFQTSHGKKRLLRSRADLEEEASLRKDDEFRIVGGTNAPNGK